MLLINIRKQPQPQQQQQNLIYMPTPIYASGTWSHSKSTTPDKFVDIHQIMCLFFYFIFFTFVLFNNFAFKIS